MIMQLGRWGFVGLLVIGFTTSAGAQALMFDFDNNGFGEGPFGPAHAEFNGDGVLNEDVDAKSAAFLWLVDGAPVNYV